jgi:hypothetical protein
VVVVVEVEKVEGSAVVVVAEEEEVEVAVVVVVEEEANRLQRHRPTPQEMA